MPIHVKYDHSSDMSYDFALHYWKSRKLLRIALVLVVVLMGMRILQVAMQQPFDSGELMTTALPVIMIAVLWVWFIPRSMKWQLQRAEKSSKLGTEREIIFQEEVMTMKTAQSDANFSYESILKWSQSADNYFLYIGVNQAIIVPKDAIPTGAEQEMLDLLARHEIPAQA